MKSILKLNLHSRRVCLMVQTERCCGQIITDISRFTVEVKADTVDCSTVLMTYPFFDSDDEGRMCVLLDDSMKELCSGRYVFEVVLDQCTIVERIKFLWGAKPVVTDVKVESSSDDDCYDETGSEVVTPSMLPDDCCDSCGKGDKCDRDPCSQCQDSPCECGDPDLQDPEELLKRC